MITLRDTSLNADCTWHIWRNGFHNNLGIYCNILSSIFCVFININRDSIISIHLIAFYANTGQEYILYKINFPGKKNILSL